MYNINEALDTIVERLEPIPSTKRYWLIRTKSGSLYDTFRKNNFVGLDHSQVSLQDLSYLRKFYNEDSMFLNGIKDNLFNHYTELKEKTGKEIKDRTISIKANQIYKFYQKVRKGDMVIIPSYSSTKVAFGVIKENFIASFSSEEVEKFDFSKQFLNKRVQWINDFDRSNLDPNIYKMFSAHQAITEVGKYADVIERTLEDFFILDNEAHLIINVQKKDGINAKSLFGLGYNFLNLIDDIVADLGIEGISSNDFEVEVNINSPGKIDLKSKIKKGTVFALIVLAAFGGGYESDAFKLKTEGLPGLVVAITDAINSYKDKEQDRAMQKEIFEQYKNKLEIKNPDDFVKIMKQVDDNQDKPK